MGQLYIEITSYRRDTSEPVKEKNSFIYYLDQAIALFPEFAAAYYYRAYQHKTDGKVDDEKALWDINKAIQYDPQLPKAYGRRAGINSSLKINEPIYGVPSDWDTEEELLNELPDSQIKSLDGEFYYQRGSHRENEEDLHGAISDYTKAIQINPQRVDLYIARSTAYINTGDPAKAIADANAALRIYKKLPRPLGNLSIAYVNQAVDFSIGNNLDGAIDNCTKSIEIDPDYYHPYGVRGEAKFKKNNWTEAIADLKKYLELGGGKYNNNQAANEAMIAEAYLKLGISHSNRSKFTVAIINFSKAIDFSPQYTPAYHNRAWAKDKKGDFDGAVLDYTQAVQYNPQNAVAYNSRGWIKYLKNDFDWAIADFTEAIRLDSSDAFAFNRRGLAYYKQGNREKALSDYL